MSVITTSYEFHKGLESLTAFARREWRALAIFGGGFVLVMLVGVFAIAPGYFYSRLGTDPLLYYLKGLAFAETGHTVARTALNRNPFQYVAMPGVLRSPFMIAFSNFDDQLRAIQLSNILLVAATAAMYAYIMSWILPRKWHWLGIGFTFGFFLLSPEWIANVFLPLADAPFAFFSTACLLLIAKLLSSEEPIRARWWALVLAVIMFGAAFLTRFIAPVLLIYAGLLAAGRKRQHLSDHRALATAAIGAVILVILVVALNWEAIRSRYLLEPGRYLLLATKTAMMSNFLALALPSQIISDFRLGYPAHPIINAFHVEFGTSARALVVAGIGLLVSAVTFFGMWRSRTRLVPEIAYVLAATPVLAIMIQSTSRYLMTYQPFFWIFFFVGASVLLKPLGSRIGAFTRAPLVRVALVVLFVGGLALLRSTTVVGTRGTRGAAVSFAQTRGYIRDVSNTFTDLRTFLETLPRNRTRLLSGWQSEGRWKVISGLDYFRADSTLSVAAQTYDTYFLSECGTYEACRDFDYWEARYLKHVNSFGPFDFEPAFSRITEHAKVRLYRVRNRQ